MPQRPQQYQEMLAVGPFGGIDATTSPYFLNPVCLADCRNLIPNAQYGGYLTVPGRIQVFTDQLPGTPTGMGVLQQAGQPDVYLFAATDNAGIGRIYAGTLVTGLLTRLSVELAPNQITYFVPSRKWVFVTNGVNRPIKIDTSLNVTFWGIDAPTVAPTGALSGTGPLVGEYFYCETFSNANQESSQGTISAGIIASGSSATGTLRITPNTLQPNNVVTAVIDGIPVAYTVLTGQTDAAIAIGLAGQINVDPNASTLVTARANGLNINITSLASGSASNDITIYGVSSRASNLGITPTAPVLLTGGTDGNSITVNFTSHANDPQVTTRNLYRIGGASGAWTLVNSQPVADHTAFLDTIADSALSGQNLIVFRDPPPVFKSISGFQDRIFGFGTDTDPTQTAWSNYNEPWAFNLDTNTLEAGPNDLGDQAVTCGSIGSMLMLLKDRSAFMVVGNSDNTFAVIEGPQVGCSSALSAVFYDNLAAWDSIRGIQLFDGSTRTTISDGQFMQSNIKSILDAFAPIDRAQSVGFAFDRMIGMSFPTQNRTFMFDLRSLSWFPLDMALGCAFYDPESAVPLLGSSLESPTSVNQWFASTTNGDLGQPITAKILSRITDVGSINTDKSFGFGWLEAPVQDGQVSLKAIINPGPNALVEGTDIVLDDSGQVRHRWEMPLGTEGNEIQLELTSTSLQQIAIHKVALWGKIVRADKPNSLRDG